MFNNRERLIKLSCGEIIGIEVFQDKTAEFDYKVTNEATFLFKVKQNIFKDFDLRLVRFLLQIKVQKDRIIEDFRTRRVNLKAKLNKILEEKEREQKKNELLKAIKKPQSKLRFRVKKSIVIGKFKGLKHAKTSRDVNTSVVSTNEASEAMPSSFRKVTNSPVKTPIRTIIRRSKQKKDHPLQHQVDRWHNYTKEGSFITNSFKLPLFSDSSFTAS